MFILLFLPGLIYAETLNFMTGVKILESKRKALSYSNLYYQSKVLSVYMLDGLIEYTYGEHDNKKNYETVEIKQQFDYNLFQSVYFTFNNNFLYDLDSQIERKVKIEPGIGLYTIQKENLSINLDAGPAYIITKLQQQKIEDQVNIFTRLKGNYHTDLFDTKGKIKYSIDTTQKDNYEFIAEIEANIYPFSTITNLGFQLKAIENYTSITKATHNEVTGIVGLIYNF